MKELVKRMEYILKKKKKIEIPIYDKELVLEGEGDEFNNYKEKGDVIINIFNKKNKNFKRINEYDVLTTKSININQLYSILLYEIVLPHGEVLTVQSEPFSKDANGTQLLQKIINKGLPYKDVEKNDCNGDLYIMYKVIFPKNLDELKNIELDMESANSNINENHIVAYNCNIDEIFGDE